MYLIFPCVVHHSKMQANTNLTVRLNMCTTTFSLRKNSIGCNNTYQTQSGQDTSSTNNLELHTQQPKILVSVHTDTCQRKKMLYLFSSCFLKDLTNNLIYTAHLFSLLGLWTWRNNKGKHVDEFHFLQNIFSRKLLCD